MKFIKVYVSTNEYTNTRYWKLFDVVEEVPKEEYKGRPVVKVSEVRIDCEQGSQEVFEYDFYKVDTAYIEDGEVCDNTYYIAVHNDYEEGSEEE